MHGILGVWSLHQMFDIEIHAFISLGSLTLDKKFVAFSLEKFETSHE